MKFRTVNHKSRVHVRKHILLSLIRWSRNLIKSLYQNNHAIIEYHTKNILFVCFFPLLSSLSYTQIRNSLRQHTRQYKQMSVVYTSSDRFRSFYICVHYWLLMRSIRETLIKMQEIQKYILYLNRAHAGCSELEKYIGNPDCTHFRENYLWLFRVEKFGSCFFLQE